MNGKAAGQAAANAPEQRDARSRMQNQSMHLVQEPSDAALAQAQHLVLPPVRVQGLAGEPPGAQPVQKEQVPQMLAPVLPVPAQQEALPPASDPEG